MPKVKSKGAHVPLDHPYGGMTIKELTKQLKKRGADVLGRKSDLVERLESLDRNSTLDRNSNLVTSSQNAPVSDMDTDPKILTKTEACTDTCAVKPWEEKQGEAHKMVSADKALLSTLIDSIPLLRTEIVLSDNFWNLLLEKGVLDEQLKSDLQAFDSQEFQICDLVRHLMRGKLHHLHAFLWVLVNTKQHHLVEMLGFPVRNYCDVLPMLKFRCPSCSEVYSNKAYILVQCGHYVCCHCIKGARFSAGDGKAESITCPVPDCGQVSKTIPNMEDEIGLDEDDIFMDIVGSLGKDCSKHEICHFCSSDLSLSYRKHFCSGCKKFLCGACISKHKAKDHQIIHKHSAEVCCLHGKKTETFCLTCDISRCDSKEKLCGHKVLKVAKKMNTGLQYMKNQLQDIGTKAKEFGKIDIVLENRRAEMVDFAQHHHDQVKKDMDKWLDESLSYISRMSRHVRVKHKQSLQWKAISPDLIDIQTHQPWVDLPLQKLDLTLSPEVEAFVSKVRDGEPPSNILSGLPYVPVLAPTVGLPEAAPVPAPTKAKYMAELELLSIRCLPRAAWTSDGRLIVAASTYLHEVVYDALSASCTSKRIFTGEKDLGHINIAEDGSWLAAFGVPSKLVINDVNKSKEGIRVWTPPNMEPCKAYGAVIDNSSIYVREYSTVYVYNRDLVKQRQFLIDYIWRNTSAMMHVSQTGDLLFGSWVKNAILVVDPKTGKTRSFQNKGTIGKLSFPYGMCTVSGGKYILVSEFRGHCVSVFTYEGEYLHDIQVEGGAGRPSSVCILERPGEPTLMAVTTKLKYDHWFLKIYTLS